MSSYVLGRKKEDSVNCLVEREKKEHNDRMEEILVRQDSEKRQKIIKLLYDVHSWPERPWRSG